MKAQQNNKNIKKYKDIKKYKKAKNSHILAFSYTLFYNLNNLI